MDRVRPLTEHRGPSWIATTAPSSTATTTIYGSDWPQMEGMEHPQDILAELDGVSLADQEKLLYRNTAALDERRAA